MENMETHSDEKHYEEGEIIEKNESKDNESEEGEIYDMYSESFSCSYQSSNATTPGLK